MSPSINGRVGGGGLERDQKVKKIIINYLIHQTRPDLNKNVQDVNLYKSITNIDPGSKGQGHGGL
jgi:hypothetical protein